MVAMGTKTWCVATLCLKARQSPLSAGKLHFGPISKPTSSPPPPPSTSTTYLLNNVLVQKRDTAWMHHQHWGLVQSVCTRFLCFSPTKSPFFFSLVFQFAIVQLKLFHQKFRGHMEVIWALTKKQKKVVEVAGGGGCRVLGGCYEWKSGLERGAGGRWKLLAYKVAIRRKWLCVRQEEHLCLLPRHTKDWGGAGGKTTVPYMSRAPLNTTRFISMVQFEDFRAALH